MQPKFPLTAMFIAEITVAVVRLDSLGSGFTVLGIGSVEYYPSIFSRYVRVESSSRRHG